MASMSLADAAFAARWTLDELPACPVGLSLLRRLSETEPRLYALAERVGFDDPTEPELTTHPLWIAFVDHYAGCGDCNEV